MSLWKLYLNFEKRCRSYDTRIQSIVNIGSNRDQWELNYQTEVLISDLWQCWCGFSRDLLFKSCRGAKARDGAIIPPRAGDNSWQRLGYEAKQNLLHRNITASGHSNFLIRKEPTWGDLDVFIRSTNALSPSNKSTLMESYGSFTRLKDMQKVRNACAHKNVETMNDISSLSVRYQFSQLNNAPELAWKLSRHSTEYAIESWLHEMRLIAYHATATL